MLPRLLVVTDVPVTDTVAGALQLWRLLGEYPTGRLCICEGTLASVHPVGGRLPGARHVTFYSGSPRWRRSRLVRLQAVWLSMTARLRTRSIARAIGDFAPDAVLTVAQEFACLAAGEFARGRGIPLHMILHDDWLAFSRLPAWFAPFGGRQFRRLYEQAAGRWCVSAAMEEHYRGLWSLAGSVLLPVHGGGVPAEVSSRPPSRTMTIAYAGSIPTGGRARLLLEFAKAISRDGHRLALMVPGGLRTVFDLAEKVGCQWRPDNVDDVGYVTPDRIPAALRQCADAALVAETFEPGHHDSVAYNFPSKLADYALAGLPVIVWGPPYSSAARWARENPDAAILIDGEDAAAARDAVDRLAAEPTLRDWMAEAAVRAAREQFDPARARERLYGAIANSAVNHE